MQWHPAPSPQPKYARDPPQTNAAEARRVSQLPTTIAEYSKERSCERSQSQHHPPQPPPVRVNGAKGTINGRRRKVESRQRLPFRGARQESLGDGIKVDISNGTFPVSSRMRKIWHKMINLIDLSVRLPLSIRSLHDGHGSTLRGSGAPQYEMADIEQPEAQGRKHG